MAAREWHSELKHVNHAVVLAGNTLIAAALLRARADLNARGEAYSTAVVIINGLHSTYIVLPCGSVCVCHSCLWSTLTLKMGNV